MSFWDTRINKRNFSKNWRRKMKPVLHKNKIYLPLKTQVDKLKPGDKFKKNERDRSIFTLKEPHKMGFCGTNVSGQSTYFSKGYPVIHLF